MWLNIIIGIGMAGAILLIIKTCLERKERMRDITLKHYVIDSPLKEGDKLLLLLDSLDKFAKFKFISNTFDYYFYWHYCNSKNFEAKRYSEQDKKIIYNVYIDFKNRIITINKDLV